MDLLEARVDRLEEVLSTFMRESARILAAIREDITEIRASNARTDRQLLEIQIQAEKDRQQAEKDRQQAEKDRQQAEKDRKDFNRRIAEITDSQGLMIENMVWPNLKRIATQVFRGDVLFQAIRLKRRHPRESGRMIELDLLAAGESAVLVCEAKSKVSPEKVREFEDRIKEVPEFFPEYAGYRLVPMIASIAFDASVVAFMTSRRVLALGFGDETMELINPEVLAR